MVGKTKRPTKEQKRRMDVLKHHVPCIPCLVATRRARLPSIQHTVSGFTRDGHDSTYSACEWHHFGDHSPWASSQEAGGVMGPSLAQGKRTFQAYFGPEALLVRIASFLVDEFEAAPWIDHDVPHSLRRRAYLYWDSKT